MASSDWEIAYIFEARILHSGEKSAIVSREMHRLAQAETQKLQGQQTLPALLKGPAILIQVAICEVELAGGPFGKGFPSWG